MEILFSLETLPRKRLGEVVFVTWLNWTWAVQGIFPPMTSWDGWQVVHLSVLIRADVPPSNRQRMRFGLYIFLEFLGRSERESQEWRLGTRSTKVRWSLCRKSAKQVQGTPTCIQI